MSDNPLSGKVGLDVTDFKAGISTLNREIRVIESGFKAAAAGMGDWDKQSGGLEMRIKALNSLIELQKSKASALEGEYRRVAAEKGATSKAAQDLQIRLNKENETLGKMQTELRQSNTALEAMGKEEKTTKDKTEDLDKSEKKATGSTNQFGNSMKSLIGHLKNAGAGIAEVVSHVAKLAAGLAVGLAAGAVAAVTGIGVLMVKSGEWADQFATLSGVTGISTTRLQELDYIGKKLDVDLGTISGSMSKMIRSMSSAKDGTGPAAEAYAALGISVKDSNGELRNSQDVFNDAIGALGGIGNETERDAIAMAIFGKSAMELNPLITAGKDKLAALADEANRVGAVMSEKDVEALDAFKDSADGMGNTVKGITGTIMAKFAPALTNIIGKVNEFLASAKGQSIIQSLANVMSILGNSIQIIVDSLSKENPIWAIGSGLENLGKGNKSGILITIGNTLQKFSGIFSKLQAGFKGGGIGGMLKALIPEGGVSGILSGLGGTIGKLLSGMLTSFATKPAQLMKIGLDIIQGLGTGLVTAIPALLPVFLGLLTSLVAFIAQMLPMLIQTGLTIVLQLAMGIMQAVPSLVPVVLQILNSFIQFLIQNLPMLITAAVQMIIALATGIAQALPTLIPAVIAIIPAIVLTLLANLPLLIDASLQLIIALAEGLIAALPVLIPQIPVILQAIVDAITESLPMIGAAAVTLITTLAMGIVDNLPMIAATVVNIVETLKTGVVTLASTIWQVGSDIIDGIWKGIQDAWATLLDNMAGVIAGLPEWVKKLLGIASPPKWSISIGENMAQGLGTGFIGQFRKIQDQIGSAVKGLSGNMSLSVSSGRLTPAMAGAGAGRLEITVIIQGGTGLERQAAQAGVLAGARQVGLV